ncbi:MAG: hypothetical protein AUH39_01535 [Chloroflexi bacterium 13_1_40CM_67_9]|nr:MAG: hypothetical protein AUH39_01535 [Chloroflexi bacterium 13_1_40CM_67_9]
MRHLAALLAVLVIAACSGTPPPASTATPVSDLVLPTTVPNGRVEVVVKSHYAVGDTIRVTVRLIPTTGSLRGPLDAYVQASGFHGTATVRHLAVDPVSAIAGSPASMGLAWDMRDDSGQPVGSDDYSLVFTVIDDSGRGTTVGATLQVR